MSKPIQTAIVGAGMATLVFHAPLVLTLPELFTLHSVVERSPPEGTGKGGTVGKKFSVDVKLYNSIDEMLQDKEIELVILATPNTTHYPFAKAALEAGKHVLVDKPVTTSYEDAVSLEALADSRKLVLYAFQNRRWDSDFLTLRSIIQTGSLGPIWDFSSNYDRYRPNLRVNWRSDPLPGSGIVFDLGSHLIDQAIVLFGRPAKITGFLENQRGIGHPDVSDCFTIILYYPREENRPYSITATLRGHMLSQRTPQLRYTVRGANGTFVKYGLDTQEAVLVKGTLPDISTSEFGVEPKEIWGELEVLEGEKAVKKIVPSEKGTYVQLLRGLAASIKDGAVPQVKWKEAALGILLIELALKSSKEGKTFDVPKA